VGGRSGGGKKIDFGCRKGLKSNEYPVLKSSLKTGKGRRYLMGGVRLFGLDHESYIKILQTKEEESPGCGQDHRKNLESFLAHIWGSVFVGQSFCGKGEGFTSRDNVRDLASSRTMREIMKLLKKQSIDEQSRSSERDSTHVKKEAVVGVRNFGRTGTA